jgi:excisionase family DNA binding protein
MRATKPAAAAPDAVEPIFLTLKDAAIRLRCSPKTIRRRVKAGRIRATPEGGRKLIAIEDFYAYIERLRRDRKRP